MKKTSIFIACALPVFMFLQLSGCKMRDKNGEVSSNDSGMVGSARLKDGEYKASANTYDDSGYKAIVKVVVKDGAVYSIDCDAEHKDEGTKKTISESGKYGMKAGGAQHEWHEEIAYFEKYATENGVSSITLNKDGKTDVITGCTIAVGEYVDLINEALEKAEG